jgi:RND family efflux transporter MFP subunit
MKRLKIFVVLFLISGAVIALLLNNKAKMEAKTVNNNKTEAYYVKVEPVTSEEMSRTLELVGTITANNDVAVVSESMGKVETVNFKTGDYVTAGSVMFRLDDELKESAYRTAEVNYEKSQKDFERFEALYKNQSVTDAQYESSRLAYLSAGSQYITAKRQYEDTRIKAPISGIVTDKKVDLGAFVNSNTVVANIVDISKLKVKLSVAEKDAFRLKPGDIVSITTDVYPGVKFAGTIEFVSVKGDEAHTYPVEISLKNSKEHPLKVGMFGKVSFKSAEKNKMLVIPREALIGSIKDPKVYVASNGTASLRTIVPGYSSNNKIEVLSGLLEGEQVVVNGQNNLKDNDKVIVR